MPTAQIELSPEMVRIIKGIAPKKKRSRAPWIVAGLVAALVVIVGVNRTLRQTVVELVQRVRTPRAPIVPSPAPTDSALAPASTASEQPSATAEPSAVAAPASVVPSAAPSASASAAPTSTHRHHHHAAPRHSR